MNDSKHPNSPGSDPSPAGDLIRQFVDGELAPSDAAALESRAEADEDLARRIRFERGLRTRVAHVMDGHAPADLADRVRAALRDAPDTPDTSDTPQTVGTIEPERRSWLAGPARANVFAVAASLALIAGAVLFGIFGPRIDEFNSAPAVVDVLGKTAVYASQEHGRCAGNSNARDSKGRWKDAAVAADLIAEHLDVEHVPVFDLSDVGYRFLGAGNCKLPYAEQRSAHVIFTRPPEGDRAGAMVSIFIAVDEGQYDWDAMDGLDLLWDDADASEQCTHRVMHLRNSELVYFLVCCDPTDQTAVQATVREIISRSVR